MSDAPANFVSYASPDEARVRDLLRVKGLYDDAAFFAPETLRQGDVFPRHIEAAIRGCAQFHLFWSQAAADSDWVRRETDLALAVWRARGAPDGFLCVYGLDRTPLRADLRGNVHVLTLRSLWEREAPARAALDRLPPTDPQLFGRDAELGLLRAAWDHPHVHAVSFVAWGGVGKTALVWKWLTESGHRGWPGAARVYGWSFFSQGAGEGRQASADFFIAEALRWFGDPQPDAGTPRQKGERLVELVRKEPTILVLDGLEAVQHPPGERVGVVKDDGLHVLVTDLAAANNGLLVVTTRLPVADLAPFAGTTAVECKLRHLDPPAGAALLAARGVTGATQAEREAVSEEYDGHALALRLLGGYLAEACEGDLRRRDTIPPLLATEEDGHAGRVLRGIERWLDGKSELAVLRLLGLFDRPAEREALAVVRRPPAIEGLTDTLDGIGEQPWNRAVTRLERLGFVERDADGRLDGHPLVREHFAARLRAEQPAAWQEGHRRLYEYFRALPKKDLPDTLEEMEPLFRAIGHGCAAGRHEEARREVYYRRVQRDWNRNFCMNQLGAVGADLAALAHFFEEPWERPVPTMSEAGQAAVLSWAGLRLWALGRLGDALSPMEAALGHVVERKDWRNASIGAANLSELLLVLGRLSVAEARSREAVAHADRTRDAFEGLVAPTILAVVLHQQGQWDEAAVQFAEAERKEPAYWMLYSLQGYRYCDLLLSRGAAADARRRAEKSMEQRHPSDSLLTIALDHLILGRARLTLAQDAADFAAAAAELERAVDGLRAAGHQWLLSPGLLARAALCRTRRAAGDRERAQRDLAEARALCERSGMRLYLADVHLEQARVHLAFGNPAAARPEYEAGRALVAAMGYHRRDAEVAELAAALGDPPCPPEGRTA